LRNCFVLVALCGSVLVAQTPAKSLPSELRKVLDRKLAPIVESLDGVVGYAALDLTSGEEIGRLEGEEFPTASTIKLAVLYELFRQADDGRIALDSATPLDRSQAVGGSGILRAMGTPALSLRDHAVLMMSLSDNTATNVLIDRVGMAAVNQRMAALGLKGTALRRYMIDLEAARRGAENVSTPADLATLVIALHRGEGLSPAAHRTALEILRKPKATPIRAGVPADVLVASKSGNLEGVAADAGVVDLPNRPYVFVAMATYLKASGDSDPGSLEALARASYGYFSRRASVSGYGRQIF
jgi:beta-lactamase class A